MGVPARPVMCTRLAYFSGSWPLVAGHSKVGVRSISSQRPPYQRYEFAPLYEFGNDLYFWAMLGFGVGCGALGPCFSLL